jgi:hypothetical protein
VATEENFFRSGVLALSFNGTQMDVKFFVDKKGFHILDLQKKSPSNGQQKLPKQTSGVQRPFGTNFNVQNRNVQPQRFLSPTFPRPDQLTARPTQSQSGR